MSGCAPWRERLLEADLAELASATASELSAHLAGCPACRALADEILRTSEQLASALQATVSDAAGMDVRVDAVLARLERSAAPRPPDVARAPKAPRVAPWLPLAAAALVAGLLALPAREPTAGPSAPAPSGPTATPPDVEVPAGRNVVVIPTSDPEITVLWFF